MTVEPDDLRSTGEANRFKRRDERFPCLFPGMVRILFPEKSFVPINLAVRVGNVSPGGALIEVHEGNIEESYSSFEGCFFELRIATGDVPLLYGRVVRSDMSDDYCMLGLRFHKSYPEVIGQLIHEDIGAPSNGHEPLEMPVLNPFSPISDEPVVYLSGEAADATEVIAFMADEEVTRAPVHDQDFTLKLDLRHEDFNEFRIVSTDGTRESHPLPVIVAWVPLPENDFHFHVETTTDISGYHILNMDYMGSPKAAAEVLREFADLTVDGKHARFNVRLKSLDPFDPQKVRVLKKESGRIRLQSVAEED